MFKNPLGRVLTLLDKPAGRLRVKIRLAGESSDDEEIIKVKRVTFPFSLKNKFHIIP
jgi:hypothetical protein